MRKKTKRHRSIPGKNTSSVESYFCSMKTAFQCATCFRYLHQLAPPPTCLRIDICTGGVSLDPP